MKKNPYLPTAASIYVFFLVYGMMAIIISQHSDQLQSQWGSTQGQVLVAISGIGIGKLIGPSFAGLVSDRIGRRWMLLIAFALYMLFLIGLLVSRSYQQGFALAMLFGLANAISDTGAYPTLMESFPKTAGSANMLVKAAIAAGQLLLPLIITAIAGASIFWGSTFWGLIVILALLLVVSLKLPYPDYKALAAEQKAQMERAGEKVVDQAGAKVGIDGVSLVLYGFTATAMFWLAQNSLPKIGVNLAGMSTASGRGLVSWYSIGSFAGVFITASLVARRFKPVTFLMINPIGALVAYIGLLSIRQPGAYILFAFLIGYFAAGGLFQLAVVVLAQFFPVRKGFVTSMIGLASGVAAFLLPYLSGVIVGNGKHLASSYQTVVLLGVGVSIASLLLGVLIVARHRTVFAGTDTSAQPTPVEATSR